MLKLYQAHASVVSPLQQVTDEVIYATPPEFPTKEQTAAPVVTATPASNEEQPAAEKPATIDEPVAPVKMEGSFYLSYVLNLSLDFKA